MELMKLMTTHDFDPAKAIDDGMLPITSVGISTFRMNLQAFHEHLEAVLEKMEDKLDEGTAYLTNNSFVKLQMNCVRLVFLGKNQKIMRITEEIKKRNGQ